MYRKFVNSIVRRPEDELLLRSKHIVSRVIKVVALGVQSVLYFTVTLVAHRDDFRQKKNIANYLHILKLKPIHTSGRQQESMTIPRAAHTVL
jgi:hypothetical protein